MVDDDSCESLNRGSFIWRDWWLPTVNTTGSVLLGVVVESCWEIELCLRLGQTSTIFLIYFCENVFTLGFCCFYPGYKCSWTLLLFLPRVRRFFCVPGILWWQVWCFYPGCEGSLLFLVFFGDRFGISTPGIERVPFSSREFLFRSSIITKKCISREVWYPIVTGLTYIPDLPDHWVWQSQ